MVYVFETANMLKTLHTSLMYIGNSNKRELNALDVVVNNRSIELKDTCCKIVNTV